jgi:hypothetical protein
MRFRQMAVVVVDVIVTAAQYIGPAGESSTAGEIAEKAEGTGNGAGANHGGTEGTEVSRGEVA